MEIKVSRPGSQNPEPHITRVTLTDDGEPWYLDLRFTLVAPDEHGAGEWICTGVDVRARMGRFEMLEASRADIPRLDGKVATEIMARLDSFIAIAGHMLDSDHDAAAAEAKRLRALGQGRRGLDDEFFEMIGAQYRQIASESASPVTELASAYDVHRATVSRWLARARELEQAGTE